MAIHKGKIRQRKPDGTYDYLLPETTIDQVHGLDETVSNIESRITDLEENGTPVEIEIIEGTITREHTNYLTKISTITGTEILFDKNSPNIDYNGFYNLQGQYQLNTSGEAWLQYYGGSGYIAVEPNTTYYTTVFPWLTYWTSNKTFISGVQNSQVPYTFTTPTNCHYVYFAMGKEPHDLEPYVLVKGTQPPSTTETTNEDLYTDEKLILPISQIRSELHGLKWTVIGDSISSTDYATKPYHNIIATKHNMKVTNNSITGSCIATGTERPNPFVERYVNLSNDADIITVMGGGNDCGQNVPLGTITDTSTSTFYGALNTLCSGLITKYPLKRIGFITPIQATVVTYEQYKSYIDAIKVVCAKYSIPVLDLFNGGGIYPYNTTINNNYFVNADGMHPNNAAHEFMARRIEAFIKTL